MAGIGQAVAPGGELHMKHQHQQEDIHKDAVPEWVQPCPSSSSCQILAEF